MWWWSDQPKNYVGQPPRTLTDPDFEVWFEAAEDRQRNASKRDKLPAEQVQARNPWRWRRLQKDIRWVQKELKRLGYSPDDWRRIL
jgi:hypothetical protein